VLNGFDFKGDSEYLGYLMARFYAPLLNAIDITFFNQLILDISYLPLFLGFAEDFEGFYQATVNFGAKVVGVKFESLEETSESTLLKVDISCGESDWQLSSLVQIFSSALPPSCSLELLYIVENPYRPTHWQDDMDSESSQWLELLRPLTPLEELHLSWGVVPRVASALQGLADDEVMEVLPALQFLVIQEFRLSESRLVQEAIERFLASRQACGHSVAFQDRDLDIDSESERGTESDDDSD
jgi:hypothetical protein